VFDNNMSKEFLPCAKFVGLYENATRTIPTTPSPVKNGKIPILI
jgi:hypothetical protein